MGVTEEQIYDLPMYRTSAAFDTRERLVIDLAVEMARAPVDVPEELMVSLRASFDERELVELTAAIRLQYGQQSGRREQEDQRAR